MWHSSFDESDRLPEDEGYLTTCYEIKKTENLLFLYKSIIGRKERRSLQFQLMIISQLSLIRDTYLPFERNSILFGAPGTGKSFTLNHEKELLLAEGGEYERVTFHPDYSLRQFCRYI